MKRLGEEDFGPYFTLVTGSTVTSLDIIQTPQKRAFDTAPEEDTSFNTPFHKKLLRLWLCFG
ncbi:hypothetical protein VKT23_010576 [Stygiomarasmius scandens]|uniref:Uncharacterized protein n=1 Tax=Marasmiellus scandens TaxID=2682957 RepID=A0ABR1JBL2_9AGAR